MDNLDDIFNDEMMLELIKKLNKKRQTITCAESCTGGLISSKITRISGSSAVFKGSIVTYCNEIKEKELGVKKETMIEFGVVSKETVKEMLDGVMKKFDADFAVAVSGVAGPTGGTAAKPVGMVVIGAASREKKDIEVFNFNADRIGVQELSARSALRKILKILQI